MPLPPLTFLKLGGSLITDKDTPRTPRREVLARLAGEIASARQVHPRLPLILGHGSGSFGHSEARKHNTRQGVHSIEGWLGFAAVWKEARALNQIVLEALLEAGLPVIAFPPSAAVIASGGKVKHWDLSPITAALGAGLIPLINGDTIFDDTRGGTILSTEDLFLYLAAALRPKRILLAGREAGVWADFPACTQLIPYISEKNFDQLASSIGGSASVDVTGGMIEKVRSMLALTESLPELRSIIFSGSQPGLVSAALTGQNPGTLIGRAKSEGEPG
jgi:isopentenyl phosphate kinase